MAHRVVTETSNGATHRYCYDLAGNRRGVQYGLKGGGNGKQIESTYDALNRLSTLTEGGRMTVYDYDLGGNVVSKTLPNADAVVYHYDSVGRAYEEEGVSHQGVLYYYLSLCDAVGNLESSFEYTANLPLRTVAMGYDAIDRLTSEQVTDSNGSVVNSTTYVYDAANNRTRKIGVLTTTYSYNSTNELTGWSDTQGKSASYGYDSNGNRLSRSANGLSDSYTYDAENRLVGLTINTLNPSLGVIPGTYSYQYDYRTRRVSRTENNSNTQLVFSGGTSVQEYAHPAPSAMQLSAEYVRGSDWGGGVGGILYTMRGGSASFDHYDRRGDVTSRTDSSGSVTWQASYEAFGTRTQEQGTTEDRQKANTKEEDPTGLLNEGMRYRDLETGIFITRDPAGFVDGPNLYAYVRQNPWTKFDPKGLEEKTAAGATIDRDGHHVSPVETWDKNKLSKEVQQHLNEVRIKNDEVDHGWSKAHKSYNERADALTEKYVKEARRLGTDPSSLSGKEAKKFADGLIKELEKDSYLNKFNEMVRTGHGTVEELNTMRKAALAEGMLKETGLLAKVGRFASKVEGFAEHLPIIGVGLAALGFAADAKAEGVNQAAVNSVKSATFYDVTVEPVGEAVSKRFDNADKGTMNNDSEIGHNVNEKWRLLNE